MLDRPAPIEALRCAACVAIAAAAGLIGAGAPAAAAPTASETRLFRPAEPTTALGLIVKLRDAPANIDLDESRVNARERPASRERAMRHAARLEAVVDAAGLGGPSGRQAPARRPVGRDQQLLRYASGVSVAQAQADAARLAARPEVEWVSLDTRERPLALPNDPYAQNGQQWWLRSGTDSQAWSQHRRGAPGFAEAWSMVTGSAAARVAVLDSGYTWHPELAGRLLPGYDFVSSTVYSGDGDGVDPDATDPGDFITAGDLAAMGSNSGCQLTARSSWHGTMTAGIVAALTNDGVGVAGANWNGQVVPVRISGKCGATVADIINGMRWAAGLPVAGVPNNPNPARVINLSFGGSPDCSPAYQAAVDELRSVGAVVVAAAGNEFGAVTRPATCRGVVGVAALNQDGFKANYSNFGSALAATGIATVGGDDSDPQSRWSSFLADSGILTIGNAGAQVADQPAYYQMYGTSFAAPIVSGAISLMLSANPNLSYDQIIDGLRKSARPHVTSGLIAQCSTSNPGRCICTSATCGVGILDVGQAVSYAFNPGAYVRPAFPTVNVDDWDQVRAAVASTNGQPDRVAVAPTPQPQPQPSGGGGGAFDPLWLIGLFAAAAAARRVRYRG